MANTQHTPGPVSIANGSEEKWIIAKIPTGRKIIAKIQHRLNDDGTVNNAEYYDNQANADLIVEAFNVATETGLTPRQLADQRAELLEALEDIIEGTPMDDLGNRDEDGLTRRWRSDFTDRIKRARAAIAKARGEA